MQHQQIQQSSFQNNNNINNMTQRNFFQQNHHQNHNQNNENYYKSMYLSTFKNQKKKHFSIQKNQLNVDDIEGARSKFIQKPRKIRDTFINQNYDIDKSTSKMLIPQIVNKLDNQLRTQDIVIRSKKGKFLTTRNTNPLDPVYQLPLVYIPVASPPKFIRDNMHIDDIEGVRQKQTFAMRIERSGKVLEKEDLANCKKKPLLVKQQNFMLDVRDINLKKDKQDPTKHRHTNPLEPVYRVSSDIPNQPMIIGQIQKSKAKVFEKIKTQGKQQLFYLPLETADILGAQSHLRHPNKNIPKKETMQFTKPGSFKRGISSKRDTNPLKPDYKYPGWSENQNYGYNQNEKQQKIQTNKAYFNSAARPKSAAQRLDAFLH